jgi:hypothetical protein
MNQIEFTIVSPSLSGETKVTLPDLNQLLHLCLYHEMPIELISIVNSYYGDFASVEKLFYTKLAEIITTRFASDHSRDGISIYTFLDCPNLPYINIPASDFTASIYHSFGTAVIKSSQIFFGRRKYFHRSNLMHIQPHIFYEFYKKVLCNENFVPPYRNHSTMPPSLSPPFPNLNII